MTPLAPHLTAFFQERLTLERQASINTCDSYAYAFKLLLNFASKRLKVAPSRLGFEQLDAPLVVAFHVRRTIFIGEGPHARPGMGDVTGGMDDFTLISPISFCDGRLHA